MYNKGGKEEASLFLCLCLRYIVIHLQLSLEGKGLYVGKNPDFITGISTVEKLYAYRKYLTTINYYK